jgi:hypothetical protein
VSYTDLRDFEPETVFEVPGYGQDHLPLSIAIAKSGGGRVGRTYKGLWRAVVSYDGRELYRGGDLNTAQPSTHGEAAAVLADFLATDHEGTGLAERLTAWADHYLAD